ncbi:MAG: endonuclease/exonuclease/phosphatase family protein [Candidatus Anammoxibacter sp.]
MGTPKFVLMKQYWWFSLLLILSILSPTVTAHQFPPSLLITEAYYDTLGADGDEEWFEIANVGTTVDWQPQSVLTPGDITLEGTCTQPTTVQETLLIGQIQGNDDISARIHETVTFRGVVIGMYEDINMSGAIFHTLFVQDIPGTEDGDPATSDGIAIFLRQEQPFAQIGDYVLVTGLVKEYHGFTEIDDRGLTITIESSGNELPIAIEIDPPADNEGALAYYEPLEGMRVSVGGTAVVVGPTYSGCGFSVVRQDVNLQHICRHRSQDGVGQIISILHNSDVTCGNFPNVSTGDQVAGLTGPLIYQFGQFKIIHPDPDTLTVTINDLPTAVTAPALADNQISIVSFNMENYFDLVDDTGSDTEPKPTPDELALKQSKIAYAIGVTLNCPTLISVAEVEKASLLHELAEQAADYCGFIYQVSHLESADKRGIDVALMSDPNRVTVQSMVLQQACATIDTRIIDFNANCTDGEQPLFSRPPLQVETAVDGRPLTLFINHFKSKRGGEVETAPHRLAQAQHMNGLVNVQLAENPEANIVVIGDFNDYEEAEALLTMTKPQGPLVNILMQVPEPERYSYVFAGASQLIDGVLLSPALVDRVDTVTILHTNADYAYTLAKETSPDLLPFRATDHDLPLVVLAWQDVDMVVEVGETDVVPLSLSPTHTPSTRCHRNATNRTCTCLSRVRRDGLVDCRWGGGNSHFGRTLLETEVIWLQHF